MLLDIEPEQEILSFHIAFNISTENLPSRSNEVILSSQTSLWKHTIITSSVVSGLSLPTERMFLEEEKNRENREEETF